TASTVFVICDSSVPYDGRRWIGINSVWIRVEAGHRVWLSKEDFFNKVPIWWNEVANKESAILTLTAKLRHCRVRMKEWCKTNFHSIDNAIKCLQAEIQRIDQFEERNILTQDLRDKRVDLLSQLQIILKEEEILWKTRAKQHWLKEGDNNTKFFHAVANGRKRSNTIEFIEDDTGRQISNDVHMRAHFFQSFKRLFGQEEDDPTSIGDWGDLYSEDTLDNPGAFTTPFTMEEVKKATFQLGGKKAPGPDGFPLIFFQHFWETVKENIFNIFLDLQNNVLLTTSTDYAYVCLIPKKEGASKVEHFRPISLINGIQKIISKVLANRLAAILPTIISPAHIKVDFEKAYDNVRWNFLHSRDMVVMDRTMYLQRQNRCIGKRNADNVGDPLSPYLFILVADCLARITEAATKNNLIQGIGPSANCQTVLLQYADDTLFFSEPKKGAMRNLLFIWKIFEWASGLKINTNKTELVYFGPNVSRASRLADILGCRVGKLPFRYLGLTLHTRTLRKEDWVPIINRMQARIEGWKAKLLSHGGRLTLVNSVLSNLPLFYFSIFKAPQWVLNRIEGLRRAFFWKGNMEATNTALLTKWWWRFFKEPNQLWGRKEPSDPTPSEVFRCGVSYVLGNGKNIRLWSDIWIEETPLSTRFPGIHSSVVNKEATMAFYNQIPYCEYKQRRPPAEDDIGESEVGGVRRIWAELGIIHNAELRAKSLTRLAAIWIFREGSLNAIRALERVTSLITDWTEFSTLEPEVESR
ncbi:LINE-1 retrotransposable element ORF2 protein, partial [Ananas comosus]